MPTDKELRDAAVEKLKQTTVGYKNKHWTVPPEGSAWEQGLELLAQIGQAVPPPPPPPPPPPSGNQLSFAPPGYSGGNPRDPSSFPGFTVLRPTSYGMLTLDPKPYVIVLDRLVAPATSGAKRFGVAGGSHVVLVGGEIECPQVAADDHHAFFIDGGDPTGIVHVEGVKIRGVNGFTVRTPRRVQLANIHASIRTQFSGPHPDLIQVWRNHRSAGIFIDGFTGYSDFTYFSDLTDIATPYGINAPAKWSLKRVDLHNVNGKGLNNWLGDPAVCVWEGEGWLDTSTDSAGNRRDLGDQLRQHGEQYNPKHAGYQILDAQGNVDYEQAAGIASGAPGDIGRRPGDSLRYHLNPRLANMAWRWGVPPEGEFVKTAGQSYVSPLYG